ncbi:hypothetical protein BGZ61DRAFT_29741 [Ilyonectria robusta]|uniref:uncharacterized protein n=1 Tax=Ilyonectria robusta TaxID=1079257 RepID=UPI001E8CDBE3|nr:uncharacterized protein BGZ61DRAFT_29741 [Ilyonectria robusta]KAH8738242.1 hypothetical protein BGZ61DRAFT_29741 [Ilyonectria robusta]
MGSTNWHPWSDRVVSVGGLGTFSRPHLADLRPVLHLPLRMSALRQVYQLSPMTIQVSVGLSKIKYDRPLPKALGRYISVPVTISRSCPHRHVNPEHERSPPIVPPRILPCLECPPSRIPQLSPPCYPPGRLLRGMACPWLIAETSKPHWHASISSRVIAGFSSLPDRSPAELLSSV